jgi:hypothetical protein
MLHFTPLPFVRHRSGSLRYGAVTVALTEEVANSVTPPPLGSAASMVTLKVHDPAVHPVAGR